MKKIVIPNNLKQIEKLKNKVEAILLPIKNLSIYFENEYEIEEIINIANNYNIEIFVSINKNIFNKELTEMKRVLDLIQNSKIKGVFYYDLAILNYYKEKKYTFDLIWNQEHFTTNYFTINYYYNEGVKGCYLSNDITKEEIINIKKNTSAYLIVNALGYTPMFTSRRHLVKNYLKTFNLKESNNYYLEKKDKRYKIIDDKNGSTVYTDFILNGIKEIKDLKDNNIEYILFNSFNIDENIFLEIIELVNKLDNNYEEIEEKINDLLKNTDKGFLYNKTIYEVKKQIKYRGE